ncbi:YraN family protein [candidate division WWE3 bacterium CG10_big_fil_rev_8_21_14_0_10_32_10]|uniref:UPF0102 protein COV24_01690 n=1 Tax=candidate division WWE3 bacterium CG10_big_fil_rev_8_21_14_0_10_32_10 TaxID=1975090 RepID=A0A2H0RAR2_UNCKA|nr:MAG: YraN family protein [candidate division WWE3 bacterium CG10_big_fil_rev_8_21_14_0_10_32_10]
MLSKIFGDIGENKVTEYCEITKKYKILNKNYKCKNYGEIDIVAKKDDFIIFIEVKSRKNSKYMEIYEVIDKRKKEALLRAAKFYIIKKNLGEYSYRIDLATYDKEKDKIEYFENIIEDHY